MELSDAISKDVAEKIRKEIVSTKGVNKVENLRVRRAGSKIFVEVTIQVPEYMSLEDAHGLTSEIEERVRKSVGHADVIIHTEPVKSKMRTEELVEKIAKKVEGVKEVHKIKAVYTNGKLYIILHARVDPKLSIQEAHKIAGEIEDQINARITEAEDVTVHIEPFSDRVKRISEVDDIMIRRIVYRTLEDFPEALRCKRIITYTADRKHYVNIDCSFTSQISIEEAHKIASLIEKNIRRRFTETVVTVHTEPS